MEEEEKIEETIEEEEKEEFLTEEEPTKQFSDMPMDKQRSIKELWIGTIKDIVTKGLRKLLTETQYNDLTDGGATTLHKHDHGGMDGLGDNDHPQYIEKDGTTSDVSADIPLNSNKLTGVKDPTADQDAATKKYGDDTFQKKTYVVGDQILASDDSVETSTSVHDTYTELKSITLKKGGTLRIKFKLRHTVSNTKKAIGRIYRNGAGVGATGQDTPINDTDWHSFSEDIAGWSAGDTAELWAAVSLANGAAEVKDFQLCIESVEQPTEGETNPGNILEASADTERGTSETTYTKLKEITAGKGGTLRVNFYFKMSNDPGTSYARIYKNGVALGTERSTAAIAWVNYTEDLAFDRYDKIQLYGKGNGSTSSVVKEFRIYTNDWTINTD